MRRSRLTTLTLALALPLLAVPRVFGQSPGQITELKLTRVRPLGEMKVVEGVENGIDQVVPIGCHPGDGECYMEARHITVWVNGISTRPDPRTGKFRVLIPNEPLTEVEAHQEGLNVWASVDPRDMRRMDRFETLAGR